MLSKSCMPIGYFIIVLLMFLQTYDILCRKTIIRYVLSYPSSPPTKLPLLPPSSPWRGCSRTPFGRRSCCNGFVEILPIVSLRFRCPPVTNVCNRGESLTSVLTFNHYQHLIIVFLHLMFLGEFVGTRICTS